MAEPAERRWTVEEFLAWDDGTDRRYELIGGQIVAMARRGRRTRRSLPTWGANDAAGLDRRAESSASSA